MGKVIVYHRAHGCDTGCCGHVVRVQNDDGTKAEEHFTFAHPAWESAREFAEAAVKEEFGADHVADLAWEECEIIDD
jgi:hypothetical protein